MISNESALREKNDGIPVKRPAIRFSFMGRNVEDLTDDEAEHSDLEIADNSEDEATLGTPTQVETEGLSIEDEKRMIREQLLLISNQLGQLTGKEQNRSKRWSQKRKKRAHTFPDRKEKEKILSIRISLPQEAKGKGRKGPKSTHSSPSTVLSTTNLSSFGMDESAGSDTESVALTDNKDEVDPLQALQGIASAKPTACNLAGSSKQHNTDEVVSSGLVSTFKLPAWRLAPEIDLPRFRLVDDYGISDPHFGEGYDFLTTMRAREERINSNLTSSKKRKCYRSISRDESSSFEVNYQKFYRNSKRRSLQPTSTASSTTDSDIEDTSDAVYQKLHRSQEKAEKERMTSLYNQKMRDTSLKGKGDSALTKGKPHNFPSR
jgi:hypothetical protein